MITLKDFDHLRSEKMIRFTEELIDGTSVTIISYMISSANLWKLPHAIECRGITFDSLSGECICRPLPKFFNVGENDFTRIENLPLEHLSTVMEKRDGSMLTSCIINDKLYWKSKKTFFSNVAVAATKFATDDVIAFSKFAIESGYTPIFEFTSDQFEIVINYGSEPKFVLLAMRSLSDGEYLDYTSLKATADKFNIEVIPTYKHSFAFIQEQMTTLENFEGYVLRFDAHNMTQLTKIKSDWYLRNHRVKTMLRERDVADMMLNETIDDIKSMVTRAGLSLDPIETIERRVLAQLEDIAHQISEIIDTTVNMSQKEVAIKYKDHKLVGLIMNAYSGKDVDYKKYWNNIFRSQSSLPTIYSNFLSGEIDDSSQQIV